MPALLILLAAAVIFVASQGESQKKKIVKFIDGSTGGSTWSDAALAWGEPRVPPQLQARVELARANGWFPMQPTNSSESFNALVACASSWELLTGKRESATWVDAFAKEASGPDTGSLYNAVSWFDVVGYRDEWKACVKEFACPAKTMRVRRDRYVAGLDQWRRAGLLVVVARGLENEPGPGL